MRTSESGLLLTWYGDDFSGSTDVMEALERNGVPAVLFLRTPNAREVARFAGVRAIGIAGVSRSHSPEWMSQNLPPVFRTLKSLGAPLCQYKVCSTFDSSPTVGSIGYALDLGQEVFSSKWVPLVIGAPALRRYTLFGNLFATVDGVTWRLDRHPTMSRHPVTPMAESDLRLHLSRQTNRRIGLIDMLALQSDSVDDQFEKLLAGGAEVVLFDVLDEASLREIGRLVWRHSAPGQTFAVASSGLEYALVAWWRASGEVPVDPPVYVPQPCDRILVVSGSCSPVTESQIRWAAANGFAALALDPSALLNGHSDRVAAVAQEAESALCSGRSVIIYTALGPETTMTLPEGGSGDEARNRIGDRLGELLRSLLTKTGTRRAIVGGGDTSGHAARHLDISALRMVRPLAPGGPLCRAYAENPALDGLEIVFKGGQVGGPDFFGLTLRGGG